MSLVKFKNSEDFSLKSPRFLHISQINKLVTSKKEPIRSKSPFITPKKKNVYERDSSKHKIIESPDFDSLYSCELAISAKDFISILRMKEEIKNKEIEKALINNKKYSEFNKKRSYLPKKSRVSQLIPKKFETIHPPSRNSSFSNDSSTIYRENDQYSNIILFDNTSEQSEIVWRYLNNNEIESPEIKSIKTNWVQGLTKEERGPELYHKTIKIYGWHPRILSLQKLENDMEKLYGYGINRRLKPGEEATVMENIRKILEKCEKNPEFFQYSVNTAVKKIFKKCDLENLMHFPLCYKQVETHWKIMATRFRCSGDLFLKNRKFERILSSSQAKNHFVNLNQENSILAAYLLKYSQKLSSY